MKNQIILVTAAAGSTGKTTTLALLEKGFKVRAFVRRRDDRSPSRLIGIAGRVLARPVYAGIVDEHVDGCAVQLTGQTVDLCTIGDVEAVNLDITLDGGQLANFDGESSIE